jgi:hypothetical protein
VPTTRALVVATAVTTLSGAIVGGQSELNLDLLTVPANELGSACRLAPASTEKVAGSTRVRGGLWAGLPVSSNPWRGGDEVALAAIRARIEPPPAMPDGPPMSPAELAQFRIRRARGVEEGYAAIYDDGSGNLVTVYGLRFKTLHDAERVRGSAKRLANVFVTGRTAFAVAGRDSDCLERVARHLQTLTKGLR